MPHHVGPGGAGAYRVSTVVDDLRRLGSGVHPVEPLVEGLRGRFGGTRNSAMRILRRVPGLERCGPGTVRWDDPMEGVPTASRGPAAMPGDRV